MANVRCRWIPVHPAAEGANRGRKVAGVVRMAVKREETRGDGGREYTIRLGGAAGSGLPELGGVLAKLFSRQGYYVFTHQDSMSRVRGGHNFFQVRVAEYPVAAVRKEVDLLLALNGESLVRDRPVLKAGGVILCDPALGEVGGEGFWPLPLAEIIAALGIDPIMSNGVAVGAICGILGFPLTGLAEVAARFLGAGVRPSVVSTYVAAAEAGQKYVGRMGGASGVFLPLSVPPPERKFYLFNGNQAIGLGAMVSGCRFCVAVPMAPATAISAYLASRATARGMVVEVAEDEMAAVFMALGASYGGVRAMTVTSGGGFALMSAGLSWAGMSETPLVLVEVQRPGPAIGLPTRTEQGDLLFARQAGHGEFPRVVFTPGSPEQALLLTNKAFHLAEKYQIPVIVQSDQYLAEADWSCAELDGELLGYENFRATSPAGIGGSGYRRYADTVSGVSPLAIPGGSAALVLASGDEHDAAGLLCEDASTRTAMVSKRNSRKLTRLREEIAPPSWYGSRQGKIVLVGYGSTLGVLREAVDRLLPEYRIALLHFAEVVPFPLVAKFDYLERLQAASLVVCIENNAGGQFAQLLRLETGFHCPARITKFDGRPFILETLLGELDGYLRGL